MTADRSYRRALSPASAAAELRDGAGTQFDPEVVEAFLDALACTDARDTRCDDDDVPLTLVADRVRDLLAGRASD